MAACRLQHGGDWRYCQRLGLIPFVINRQYNINYFSMLYEKYGILPTFLLTFQGRLLPKQQPNLAESYTVFPSFLLQVAEHGLFLALAVAL